MSEKEIVRQRIQEREKMLKAGRLMTRLFLLTSSFIFITLIVVWLSQNLPTIIVPTVYEVSTWFILASSALIVMSQLKIKEDEIEMAFVYTGLGLIFGLFFCILQVVGWNELLNSNTSYRNILFPFSVIHFLHISVGLFLLMAVLRKISVYRVHSKSNQYAHNVFVFWHFLGAVWFLFIVLV